VKKDFSATETLASKRSVSVWHDFGSDLHAEVKPTLEALVDPARAVTVEGTSLMIHLPSSSSLVWSDLLS
jgi:hypothetical protein